MSQKELYSLITWELVHLKIAWFPNYTDNRHSPFKSILKLTWGYRAKSQWQKPLCYLSIRNHLELSIRYRQGPCPNLPLSCLTQPLALLYRATQWYKWLQRAKISTREDSIINLSKHSLKESSKAIIIRRNTPQHIFRKFRKCTDCTIMEQPRYCKIWLRKAMILWT